MSPWHGSIPARACDENLRRRKMSISRLLFAFATASTVVSAAEAQTATPPSRWGAGDELGMANTLGTATWQRCAQSLANPKAKSYEVSHLRSNTMPQSPFGVPLRDKYRPTVGIPGTVHAFNGEETVSGEPGAQGTQMDAIGHFAVLPEAWDGKGEFPADKATYYGGYNQADARLAAAEARDRESAADRHHGGAARCEGLSRKGQGDAARRGGHRQGRRGDAQGAGARKPRASPRRCPLYLHRLGRQLERP